MNNKFYVYEHWRPDKNVCFYVGKGHGRRAFEMRWRKNPYHARIVTRLNQLGLNVDVRVIELEMSESDAFSLEQRRIKLWRAAGHKLANCTDGGEGFSGGKHTPETVAKIRAAHTGAVFTDSRRAKISVGVKGKKRSAESIERMRIAAKLRAKALGPQHFAKMTLAASAVNQTPEVKEKRAAKSRGRKRSAEFCKRTSERQKGRQFTAQTLANMSLSQKMRNAANPRYMEYARSCIKNPPKRVNGRFVSSKAA